MDEEEFNEHISKWSIQTIIKYIQVNYIQFIMLFVVFIIIYTVDHISNINTQIFSMPSAIPGVVATATQMITQNQNQNKKVKKVKSKK